MYYIYRLLQLRLDLHLDRVGVANNGLLQLHGLRKHGFVEVSRKLSVDLLAVHSNVVLSKLNKLPQLHNVRVHVLEVLRLSTSQLGLDLILLEQSMRVHVCVQEAVNLSDVRSSVRGTSVQTQAQLVVGMRERVDNSLHTVLESRFLQVRALVGEKVNTVKGKEPHKEGSEVKNATSHWKKSGGKMSLWTSI